MKQQGRMQQQRRQQHQRRKQHQGHKQQQVFHAGTQQPNINNDNSTGGSTEQEQYGAEGGRQ
jgi:hypothetical protein